MPLRLWKKQTAAPRPPRALPLWTLSARGLPSLLVPETHEPVLSRTPTWSPKPSIGRTLDGGTSHLCVLSFLTLMCCLNIFYPILLYPILQMAVFSVSHPHPSSPSQRGGPDPLKNVPSSQLRPPRSMEGAPTPSGSKTVYSKPLLKDKLGHIQNRV